VQRYDNYFKQQNIFDIFFEKNQYFSHKYPHSQRKCQPFQDFVNLFRNTTNKKCQLFQEAWSHESLPHATIKPSSGLSKYHSTYDRATFLPGWIRARQNVAMWQCGNVASCHKLFCFYFLLLYIL